MTYFHRSNFRGFNVNPVVAPARKAPRAATEIAAELPLQHEPVEVAEDKSEKLPG